MLRIVLSFVSCAAAAGALFSLQAPALAQSSPTYEKISPDRIKLIEYAVRSQNTQGNWAEFILQNPRQGGVYCGWIVEDFGKSAYPQRKTRLFSFFFSKDDGEPVVFIDRPEEDTFSGTGLLFLCHDAGYITSRYPVGSYAKYYMEVMLPNDLQNNAAMLPTAP